MDLSGQVVVLVRTEGPINLGSVARLCGNFGVSLRLVGVRNDVLTPEAFRMAHPCQELLASAPRHDGLEGALSDVSLAIATTAKIEPASSSPPLDVARARGLLPREGERIAWVFGNERTGLRRDEAARCARAYRLRTRGPVESLNLASAVAVVLTTLSEALVDTPGARASIAARERLIASWREALDSAGLRREGPKDALDRRLMELVSKMDFTERDAELVACLFRALGRGR
ncbi:MAG: RNA methyltransferase [Deltaproteobacteria bacterium]|nr:RNA methyltransferase [Deltaproteobacteria bacterium]